MTYVSEVSGLTVPTDARIVTADVTALYPNMNMNIARSLDIVRQLLIALQNPASPDDVFIELHDIALNVSDFEFDKRFFIQLCGTAIGKKLISLYTPLWRGRQNGVPN